VVLNVEASGNLDYSLPANRLDMLQKFFSYLEQVAPREDEKIVHKVETGTGFGKSKGKEKEEEEVELEDVRNMDDNMMIQDWGISQTTLEEVFMRLTHGDVHTFRETKQTDITTQQLSITLDTDRDGILGFIPVDHSTTLEQVRKLIANIGNSVPKNFEFLNQNNVPVKLSAEDTTLATNFLPQLFIRLL